MPRTLLLADDSVTIQKVVGISFANEDVRLLTVDNGDDAIARAREARPDAVLADVVMPGKNGYEVCEAIKSDPALRHIPVLLLTGTFEAFDAERAKLAGADGFVTKPFEAQLLVDRVNELLARAASAAQAATPAQAPPPPVPLAEAGAATPAAPPDAPAEREAETRAVEEDLDFAAGDDAFVFEAEDALAVTAPPGERTPLEVTTPEAFGDPLADDDLFESGDASSTRVLADDAFALEAPGPIPEPGSSAPVFEFEGSELPPEPPEAELARPPASETTILDEAWSERDDEGFSALDAAVPDAGEGPSELDLELAGALAAGDGDAEPPGEDARQALLDPGVREFDVSSSDLGDPLVSALAAHPAPPAAATPGTSPTPQGGASEAPPALRQELTAQLEKIAWEAFGDLAETLVRQTVARVEAIAWEVIPQMAESLIREEIRKLKEES
jgi:CheY-like chemotaxis protein